MSLTHCLLTLGLAAAHAAAPTGAANFEARLKDGWPYALAAAITRAEFTTSEDRALLTESLRTAPARGRLQFRSYALTDHERTVGYTITTLNGRAFTLEPAPTPGRFVLNGREVTFGNRALRDVTREVERALQQTFVAWDLLLPRSEAAAPVLFLMSISALAIYQTYEVLTTPAHVDVAAQTAERLAHLAKICDAERDAVFVAYGESETARTLASFAPGDLAGVARAGGDGCESEVKQALKSPPDGGKPLPVPRDRDLKILCANAGQLDRCVQTFRQQRPVQMAAPFDGDGESRSGQ